jgi:uncharacterized protein (DUF486 family)
MELSLFFSIFLLYLGSICYVIASYYHLKLNYEWSFFLALSIALPIVIIEYCFTLPGNFYLHNEHGFDPIHILIITIIFYFINLWLLNVFILKKKIQNYYYEIIAFILIIIAFFMTDMIH